MNQGLLRIALPKLFLWSEAERFQEYPAALARAERGRLYSRSDVMRLLFDILPTRRFQSGAPRGRQTDGIINLYGLEKSGKRYRLNGLGLLSHQDGLTQVTEEGLRLGEMYRENPLGEGWVEELVRVLLLREPRTRLLVGLVAAHGFGLRAQVVDGVPRALLALESPTQGPMKLTNQDTEGFNQLLSTHSRLALGPIWSQALGGEVQQIVWESVKQGPPSTNYISAFLRKGLVPMFHLGLFQLRGGLWVLDERAVVQRLGAMVLESLGVAANEHAAALPPEQAFRTALLEVSDSDGFAVVAVLADRFGGLAGIPLPDRPQALDVFIRRAMYDGKLRIAEHHPGQVRMGRGLFGDSESRRVRIEYLDSLASQIDVAAEPNESGVRSEP